MVNLEIYMTTDKDVEIIKISCKSYEIKNGYFVFNSIDHMIGSVYDVKNIKELWIQTGSIKIVKFI